MEEILKDYERFVAQQRTFWRTGQTRQLAWRHQALKNLKAAIKRREKDLLIALQLDLGKSAYEGYLTEVGLVYEEINQALKHLKAWAKPVGTATPVTLFPGKSQIIKEPYGVVLIMAAWNYPFQLAFAPLVAALAAGNCAVLKMAKAAGATAQVACQIIREAFPPEYVLCLEGGQPEVLLACRFDYIFYTGGGAAGKKVMQAAAQSLTPVTLELGGKSPCIVDETADLPLAAKRIIFGKLLNSGQTCVAPDYLLVQGSVKAPLVALMIQVIQRFYGKDPLDNPDYPRIINQKHFHRLISLLADQHLLWGGRYRLGTLKIEPALMDGVSFDSPVMQEEIFGPLLPILTFETLEEVPSLLAQREKPLALYFFSQNQQKIAWLLAQVSFGGGCINDTVMHLVNSQLPFGGVGASGMGSYHGKFGFDSFSHQKSVLHQSNKLDIPLRYPPFPKALGGIKAFLK